MKKFLGFTLGEILIALGVIGVVATLTIPQLVNGRKASEAKARFNTAYNMISKAFDDMENAGACVLPACYTTKESFYPVYKQFFRVSVDCGDYYTTTKNDSVCISRRNNSSDNGKDIYKTIDGSNEVNYNLLDDGSFVLNNGMLIMLENWSTTNGNVLITVDTNGKQKQPNRLGYDVFTFQLTNQGVFPYGAPQTTLKIDHLDTNGKNPNNAGTDNDEFCNPNSNAKGRLNGITCAYRAVTDPDYFNKIYRNH